MEINTVVFKKSKVAGRMIVLAPYSPYFVEQIKRLGLSHTWNSEKKFWAFDGGNGGFEKVEALVIDTYADVTPKTGSDNGGRLLIQYPDGSEKCWNYDPKESISEWTLADLDGERAGALFGF